MLSRFRDEDEGYRNRTKTRVGDKMLEASETADNLGLPA